jgi:hypothetical protein
MDDRTFLLGKLAALESALEAAISTHPEPGMLTLALCEAMARHPSAGHAPDVRAFAEGWLAIVTPLLTAQAITARPATITSHARRRH